MFPNIWDILRKCFQVQEEYTGLNLLMNYFSGWAQGGHDACHGDSGSPAIWEDYYDQNRAYLMAVLIGAPNPKACTDEWPEGDTDPPTPNLSLYVPDQAQWILDNTGPEVKECLPKPAGAE